MRKAILVIGAIILLPSSSGADGWEGKWVKIKQGTLLCAYLNDVDTAMALIAAGTSFESTSCMQSPRELLAVVIKDYSTLGDYPDDRGYMEVMIEQNGQQARAWAKTEHLDCCYTKN